jgi:hypothetical protein
MEAFYWNLPPYSEEKGKYLKIGIPSLSFAKFFKMISISRTGAIDEAAP